MEEVIKVDDCGGNIGDYDVPIHNAIIVHKNATNGDMIKSMFPDVEVKEKNNGYEIYFGVGTAIQYFNHQWWNTLYKAESEKGQPKQTNDSCLNFDFDKVKEILKKDDFDDLVVDHTCEEKQEQTRDEKMIDAIDFAIKATDSQDDYSMGMRNGMRYVKGLIDGKEPQYEQRRTDKEIKLGIDIGDEVVGEFGTKGVVVGIDTYEDEVLLSLLMRNHKVPQLVKASSWYKTKTNRRFPQIVEVLEQIERQNPVEDIKDNKQCRNCKHCVLIISKVDAEVGYCAKTNKGIQASLWSYCCDEYEEGDTNDTTQELS